MTHEQPSSFFGDSLLVESRSVLRVAMGRLVVLCLVVAAPALAVDAWYRNVAVTDFDERWADFEKRLPQIETLVLGTSRLRYGVNPRVLGPGAFNMAEDSQDPVEDALIADLYLSRMPKLKTVIWDLDLGAFELRLRNPTRLERYRVVREHPRPAFWHADGADQVSTFLCRSFVSMGGDRHILPYRSDGFFALPAHRGRGLDRGREQLLNERKHFDLSSDNMETLVEATNRLRRAGVRVVFVTAPKVRSYRDAIPKDAQDTFEAKRDLLISRTGAEYRSFVDALPDSEEYFENPDHLQSAGANEFSRQLAAVIHRDGEAVGEDHGVDGAVTLASASGLLICGQGSPTRWRMPSKSRRAS